MGQLVPLPRVGDVFPVVRGDSRVMRVSCHDDTGMVVLSLWSERSCRASFRLHEEDVPRLIETLSGFLRDTVAPVEDPAPMDPSSGAGWSVVAEKVIGVEDPPEPLPDIGPFGTVRAERRQLPEPPAAAAG
jgi:hypothetical protein